MKKAGAIIRVSTSRQLKGTSPEKQHDAIITLAAKQGYIISDDHKWTLAESGGSRSREGFREALDAGFSGEISRVYVYSIDRLGRDLLEMLLFLRQLDDLGIDCWSADKEQQLRDDDFILQIEGAVASKERQEIIKRSKDGMERAIKGGKYSGGIIAYGYKLNPVTKILEIQEEEAEIVRQMFSWCVDERLTCVHIAERLNAMGVPTRYTKDGRAIHRKGKRKAEKTTGIWRAGRVRNMLRNPSYMGHWEWGKRSKKRKPEERITGYSPAIVSEDVFNNAGDVLTSNQLFSDRNGRREYLLRGLIKCENCGRTYGGTYSKVGPGRSKEKIYYRCNGRTQWRKLGTEKCLSLSLNAIAVENVVWEDVKEFCKNPEIALDQLRAQRKPLDDTLEDKIADIDTQIAEQKRQEINILKIEATSQEVNPEALDAVLHENRKSLDALRSYKSLLEAEKLKSNTLEDDLMDVSVRLRRLGDRIDQASFEERRRAVVELVKDIRVGSETIVGKQVPIVTITYRFNEPYPSEPASPPAVVLDYTPALADTTATRSNLAPVHRAW